MRHVSTRPCQLHSWISALPALHDLTDHPINWHHHSPVRVLRYREVKQVAQGALLGTHQNSKPGGKGTHGTLVLPGHRVSECRVSTTSQGHTDLGDLRSLAPPSRRDVSMRAGG